MRRFLPVLLMGILLPAVQAQTMPATFHDLQVRLPASWKLEKTASPEIAAWNRARPKAPTQSFYIAYWPGFPPTPGGTMVVAHRWPTTIAGVKTEILETSAFHGVNQRVFVVFLQKGEAGYRLAGHHIERAEFEQILNKVTWGKGL